MSKVTAQNKSNQGTTKFPSSLIYVDHSPVQLDEKVRYEYKAKNRTEKFFEQKRQIPSAKSPPNSHLKTTNRNHHKRRQMDQDFSFFGYNSQTEH